jgi:hypothetical protein
MIQLYITVLLFEVPLKLVRRIKICINENYSKVRIGKHLPDTFPVQDDPKDVLSPFLFTFALEYAFRKVQEGQVGCPIEGHISFWSVLMM